MKIIYKNYTMEREGSNFNLTKAAKSISKKDGSEIDTTINIGYGMRFETCIDYIIKDILADTFETITLKKFVEEYRKVKEEIFDVI